MVPPKGSRSKKAFLNSCLAVIESKSQNVLSHDKRKFSYALSFPIYFLFYLITKKE